MSRLVCGQLVDTGGTVAPMNMSLRRRFGMRIRELRQAIGLSQEALADQAGFARTYLSRIETGGANPSLDAIETLATALQINVESLFVVSKETLE
ncbi:helix-turn-helix domain-containing protein [Cupriavidus yeoncheonensis]|nr:helix-turn-helix transcriptional regulator [Cupriavidus yeoncheonensis]